MIFPTTAFIRIIVHLALLILFSISLLSGIRLAFDNPYMPDFILHSPIIPQGNMMYWHEISAYGWIALVAYVVLQWLKAKKTQPSHFARKNTFIQINYLLIVAQTLTGLLLYLNQLSWSIHSINDLLLKTHYWLAAIFVVAVFVHMAEQLILKPWRFILRMFMPKNPKLRALTSIASILALAFTLHLYHFSYHQTLLAHKIRLNQEIVIDGHFDEAPWQSAQSVKVLTVQGNNYFASTEVEVKMLHNGLSAYMSLRWRDETASYTHLPLVKEKDGWQVKHDGFAKDDERTYYEDKFAVMLSQDSGLAGGYSIHLGKKPLPNHPQSRSGRGFHYTEDGTLRDIWHWKAVRVKRMSYLDDNHFASPSPPCEACPRYKAGYRSDPKDSGSFRANWTWFLPNTVTPLRLPMPNIKHHESSMSWFNTLPYSEKADDLPVGTQLPSVLTYEGFEGDRADVAAKGVYKDGYWHLELARNIERDSSFDLSLQTGLFLWFVPFDHAQSRHSYHLKPIKLVMEN